AATFTVTLSTANSRTVTVNYATAAGTATAGSDYSSASGTVTFNPGETSKTVLVTVWGDTVAESNETFYVNLSGGTNATIADSQGLGPIADDDNNPPTISIGDLTVTEGNSSYAVAYFTVTLSWASTQTVTVNYATANGTANGADYYLTYGSG